jgi:hypothetical protein
MKIPRYSHRAQQLDAPAPLSAEDALGLGEDDLAAPGSIDAMTPAEFADAFIQPTLRKLDELAEQHAKLLKSWRGGRHDPRIRKPDQDRQI